jgi:hypothetical protein
VTLTFGPSTVLVFFPNPFFRLFPPHLSKEGVELMSITKASPGLFDILVFGQDL